MTQSGQALCPSDQAGVWKEAQKNSVKELQILTNEKFWSLWELPRELRFNSRAFKDMQAFKWASL